MHPDDRQTFLMYTWGPFQDHRMDMLRRLSAVKEAVAPNIRDVVNATFDVGSLIFPQGRFPGRYLAAVPQQ